MRSHDVESRYGRLTDLVDPSALAPRRVILIGLGAMGHPVANQLARHGVGRSPPGQVWLIDGDRVSARNLIGTEYRTAHLGMPKAQAAAEMITEINDEISVAYWDRMLTRDDVPEVAELARQSDLLGLLADSFEQMLEISDCCANLCPQVMAAFGPRADFAEVAFSVPGGRPISSVVGRRRREAIAKPRALGCDTAFVAAFVSSLCLRLLLGDAKGSELMTCYADAPLFLIGVRHSWIFEDQPEDIVRIIVNAQIETP